MVESVRYVFYHNGTRGFTKTLVFLALKNHQTHKQILQRFQVSFHWLNHTNLNYSTQLSGNAGYLTGKPIVVANLITNTTTKSKNYTIKVSRNAHDVADNFLIFPTSKAGTCVRTNQTHFPVQFGYDVLLKCTIRETLTYLTNTSAETLCKNLQQTVFRYWSVEKNNSSLKKLVGVFGNADSNIPTDWIQMLYHKDVGKVFESVKGNFSVDKQLLICKNISSTLDVDIFHARVDIKDSVDQEKIVGITYKFGPGFSYKFQIVKSGISYEVGMRVRVKFFDLTAKKIRKYVDPPTLKIVLPHDFFYPFIKIEYESNSSGISNTYVCLLLCMIIVIVCSSLV